MGLVTGSIGYLRMCAKGVIPDDYEAVYATAMQSHAFSPIDPLSEQLESCGWVHWDDPLSTDFSSGPRLLFGDVLLMRARIDTLKVPATTLKAFVEHRIRQICHDQQRAKLTRNERSQVVDDTKRQLRRESLPKMTLVQAQWSMSTGEIRLFATSNRTVALFLDLFEKTFALKLDGMGPRTSGRSSNASGASGRAYFD